MVEQAAAIGFVKGKILDYKPGERITFVADFVYHEGFFSGDIVGAFESIEGLRAKVDKGSVGEKMFFHAQAWPEAPEEERLYLEEEKRIDVDAGYERCPGCGLPRELASFDWDKKGGKIIDGVTGEWIIYMDTAGMNAVFRELERELGEEIPGMIASLTRDFYLRMKDEHPDLHFSDLSFLKTRGFGVAKERDDASTSSVAVYNPCNHALVAGVVAALRRGGDVEWEVDPEGVQTVHVR